MKQYKKLLNHRYNMTKGRPKLNNRNISIDTWESTIKLEVAQRLYKNRDTPEIVKLTILKLPMVIYLI